MLYLVGGGSCGGCGCGCVWGGGGKVHNKSHNGHIATAGNARPSTSSKAQRKGQPWVVKVSRRADKCGKNTNTPRLGPNMCLIPVAVRHGSKRQHCASQDWGRARGWYTSSAGMVAAGLRTLLPTHQNLQAQLGHRVSKAKGARSTQQGLRGHVRGRHPRQLRLVSVVTRGRGVKVAAYDHLHAPRFHDTRQLVLRGGSTCTSDACSR